MKSGFALLLGVALLGSATVGLAQKRGHVAGRFQLEIGGYTAGWVQSVEGGDVDEKVKEKSNAPVTIRLDRDDSIEFWSWVGGTLTGSVSPKKLSAQQAKSKRRIDMTGVIITEISFPKLDAKDGKKHLELSVTIQPKTSVAKDVASAPALPAAKAEVQKRWLPSNFRVRIGGLEVKQVKKVDAFTWKTQVPPTLGFTLPPEGEAALKAGVQQKSKLELELTEDDGTPWRVISFTGISITSAKPVGKERRLTLSTTSVTMK